MKLQLQGQSLRLRLDEAELAELLAGAGVANTSWLPGVGWFSQRLVLHPGPAVAGAGPDHFTLCLPWAQVHAYARTLPCRQGLEFRLPGPEGPATDLVLLLEVDVRDSLRLRGPDRRAAGGGAGLR